jgi:inner membrane protein
MDSVTQAVLGAVVGVAVAGRRIGPRKAAIAGAVLGTMPDLDVFFPHDDPVSSYVLHRGPTHSLIIQGLATPLFAEPLVRFLEKFRDRRWTAYLMVYLVFATHALLDAMTVYGTKLLWPLTNHPFGVGSMFIIDPLYTLPLLVVAVWALFRSALSDRLHRWTKGALTISTLYLAWSAVGQAVVTDRAATILTAQGVKVERLIATPTPFNTLLWRVIAVNKDQYFNLYTSLFAGDEAIPVHAHDRGTRPPFCMETMEAAGKVATFAKGFVRFKRVGDVLMVGDLRMGFPPGFVFDFAVAHWDGVGFVAIKPERIGSSRTAEGDMGWLVAGILGNAIPRPAEIANLLTADPTQRADAGAGKPSC